MGSGWALRSITPHTLYWNMRVSDDEEGDITQERRDD